MKNRRRENIPIYIVLVVVVLVVLVIALGSSAGEGNTPAPLYFTRVPGRTAASPATVFTTVEIPASMLETPAPPRTQLAVVEDPDS